MLISIITGGVFISGKIFAFRDGDELIELIQTLPTQVLALRVIADQIEHGELTPSGISPE